MRKILLLILIVVLTLFVTIYITSNQLSPKESSANLIYQQPSPIIKLPTSTGEISTKSLKFILTGHVSENDQVVGLESNTSNIYVWTKSGDNYTLKFQKVLQNIQGNNVPVDYLKFSDIGDADGDGYGDIFGMQSNTSWVYIWSFKDDTKPTGDLKSEYSGDISNRQGTLTPIDWLAYTKVGDFDADGKAELRSIQSGTSWNYIWGYDTSKDKFILKFDGDLRDKSGNKINASDIKSLFALKQDDEFNGTRLIGMGNNAYYTWDQNGSAISQVDFCNISNTCNNKKIIFNLSQVFSNTLVNNFDPLNPNSLKALNNIISDIEKFKAKYDVYVLINPATSDKNALIKVLDKLKSSGIKFMLDVYASDTNTPVTNVTDPFDIYHGLSLSVKGSSTNKKDISFYKSRYKDYFAGIRIFEIFSSTFYFKGWCVAHPETCVGQTIPSDNFYQKTLVEQYLNYAKNNKLFVFWTDPSWSLFDESWFKFADYQSEVKSLLTKYPNLITLGYSNNDNQSRDKLDYRLPSWQKYMAKSGATKFGISNQSWLCESLLYDERYCEWEHLAMWANNALQQSNVDIVQFEPMWYLWSWPKGTITKDFVKYSEDNPVWKTAGISTPQFKNIAKTLGVDLNMPVTSNN